MTRELAHRLLDAHRAGRHLDPRTLDCALHTTGDLPLPFGHEAHCLQRTDDLYAAMDDLADFANGITGEVA